jgi:hypothetical protein
MYILLWLISDGIFKCVPEWQTKLTLLGIAWCQIGQFTSISRCNYNDTLSLLGSTKVSSIV